MCLCVAVTAWCWQGVACGCS